MAQTQPRPSWLRTATVANRQTRVMARSFGLVDHKVAEADFFLSKISECGFDFFAVRCYVSAFVASARSTTFAVQSVLHELENFEVWYKGWQTRLRADPLARFFHEFRRVNQHIGNNLVSGGTCGPGQPICYWFLPNQEIRVVPEDHVEMACKKYMATIVSLVYDCYIKFGPHIDAHQRYTAEYFESIGKTIEDAEQELGFPKDWTDIGDPTAISCRWQALRGTVTGCEINHLFAKYLDKVIPGTRRLSEYGHNHS